ncbi:YutD family protein [Levilactobacillus tangyuanensis]|uniref:YutD family protein n=1 Tax=Levilactobacillus tangyuanensis TaxID=2486021 RepID=A0ABW1TPP4_9LACO
MKVDRKDLEALVAEQKETREPAAEIVRVDETHININGHPYELVTNVRDGFDFAEFSQRFSTILSKFDYLVGDWGFEQLRLKGFYAEDRAGAKQNQIDAVQDYLYESCNFGCAYFILHNLDVKTAPKPKRSRSRRRNSGGNHATEAGNNSQTVAAEVATPEKSGQAGNKPARRRRSRRPRHRSGQGQSQTQTQNQAQGAAKTSSKPQNTTRPQSKNPTKSKNKNQSHPFKEARRATTKPEPKPSKTVTVATGGQGRRHFTIRQKQEK